MANIRQQLYDDKVHSLRWHLWNVVENAGKLPRLLIVPPALMFPAREAFSKGPEVPYLVLRFIDREDRIITFAKWGLPNIWFDSETFAFLTTYREEEMLAVYHVIHPTQK